MDRHAPPPSQPFSYQAAETVPERTQEPPSGPWKIAIREETCDPESLRRDLEANLKGKVRFDDLARSIYSTDASIYQVTPLGAVVPEDEEDVKALLATLRRHGASVTARGAGVSLAGQTCGHGVIADLSPTFDRIIEVDRDNRKVRIQPGVVLDHLNARLEPMDLFFGPDVATSSRATLGGMVNNNSSGARSILYGMTIHHLDRVREVLADGTVIDWGPMRSEELEAKRKANDRESELLNGIIDVLERNREEIKKRFPKVFRRVGGYPLDHLLEQYEEMEKGGEGRFNPARLFAGSEGTLGILTELSLNLVPLKRHGVIILFEFDGILDALRAVSAIVAKNPSAVEFLDHNVMGQALESPGLRKDIKVLKGAPQAILIAEFQGSDPAEVKSRSAEAFESLSRDIPNARLSLLSDPEDQQSVWNIRKAGLGMMMRRKGRSKSCAFIEDAAVPIEKTAEYVEELFDFLEARGLRAGAYAHASVGLLHIRPILNLYTEEGVKHLREVAEKSVELSIKYNGSFSGEHGDGFARSEFLPTTHGERLCHAFKEIKTLFDPEGILNPGKIVDPYPMDRNLRFGGGYAGKEVPTVFDYKEFETFSDAVDMCSGVGQCRNRMVATMCPSYMATKDEFHTTRARANALRNALNGRIGPVSGAEGGAPDPWATDEVMEALDLCLSCKACKTECPTGVDMARMKAEALHARRLTHGASLSTRLVAHYPKQASWGSKLAPLSNFVAQSRLSRVLMEVLFGLDRRVAPPLFHRKTFRNWFKTFRRTAPYRESEANPGRPRAVFFVDTFTNHNQPGVGIAATRVLMAAGYHVVILDNVDEGRTALSKGFLDEARRLMERNLAALLPAIENEWPLLGVEPSSILTFRDEVPNLFPEERGEALAGQSFTVSEFLDLRIEEGAATLPLGSLAPPTRLLFHGHCHAKALADVEATVRLLNRIPGSEAEMIDAGCCGMAGSFGHEKDHYDVSRLVGEERLFPAVREGGAGARIVTEGFSCHHQIEHHVPGARTQHYAEVLAEALGD